MVIAEPLGWIISQPNIVSFVFLLTFVGGIIYFLVRGK